MPVNPETELIVVIIAFVIFQTQIFVLLPPAI